MAEEFNLKLVEILGKLNTFTGEKKYRKYAIFLESANKDSERKNKFIDQYIINYFQFREEIYKRNVDFFVNKSIEGSTIICDIISIRDVLESLSKSNQEIIIDLFIELTKISERYLKTTYLS